MTSFVPLLLLILSFSFMASGQQYNILNVPDSLKRKANAIKRIDQRKLEILNIGKATFQYTKAYTILNPGADFLALHQESYDKFTSIKNIEANLYDAFGTKIRSLKRSEIKDLSGMDGSMEVLDYRIKEFGFYHRQYPYTVEFIVSTETNGLMFLPTWYGIEGEHLGVEQSSMEVVVAPGSSILHKSFNYKNEPLITKDDKGNTLYHWEIRSATALEREYASPPWYELCPAVFLSMKDFEMAGYKGSNASWESFGSFIYELKKDKDQLPEHLKSKVRELVSGLSSTYDKVKALYSYLQQNTRYISIQLGIGGWVPFDAAFVDQKKYGDCKALANFMYALLKEAGIPSIYTLVRAGRGDSRFMDDFPYSQFNHVVLCVPDNTDTIWLECTSQSLPAGYLSDFTHDRPALLVLEKGSKLVRTPRFTMEQNLQNRRVNAVLLEDGTLVAGVNTTYSALRQDPRHSLIHGLPADKQKAYLQQDLKLGTYEIKSYSFLEHPSPFPSIEESLTIEANHYAQRTARRIIITPNLMTRFSGLNENDTSRENDILINYAYMDVDTSIIHVGKGYSVETAPPPVSVECEFGAYSANVQLKGEDLVYIRQMQHKGGRFPATAYPALMNFYHAVDKADRSRVVLVKLEASKQ